MQQTQLVVVGGAIYNGRWHTNAHRFLKRHRHEIAHIPVAIFGMGPRNDEAEARSAPTRPARLERHRYLG